MSSINPYLASDVDLNKGVTHKTGYVLHLKGPLEMFRMGVSFAFAGQVGNIIIFNQQWR